VAASVTAAFQVAQVASTALAAVAAVLAKEQIMKNIILS